MTKRIYDSGDNESDQESLLKRAIMLKNAGTLRAFHNSLSATDKAALKKPLKGYVSARMARTVKKGPKGNKQARGAIGNLVEIIVFGREPNNKSQADFPKCGLELKVTGLREHDDEAKERVSLSMIDNDMVLGEGCYKKDLDTESAYSEFGPIKSANSILFIIYKYQSGQFYMDARIKAAFIWTPSAKEKSAMLDDFIIIRRMCDHGFAHCLSEGLGEFMGAATKGAGKNRGDKPAKARGNKATLMASIENELSNRARFDVFKTKAEPRLIRVGAIKRRCYSLKRRAVTEIISGHLTPTRETQSGT
jgi:DNA mismatch repair protein MutH